MHRLVSAVTRLAHRVRRGPPPAGTATDDPYGTQSQGIPCNMTGGSSGGPWLINNNSTINSVNSFGYQGVRNVMFGPYFGSDIQSAYSTAATR